MKACVIQPPYSNDTAFCDEYFAYKLQQLDALDESVDLIVLPEYSDVPCATKGIEDTLFFQMDVAGTVAGASADARPIKVLGGGIKINVVEDLFRSLAVKLGFTVDDVETVFKTRKGIGRHEGVFASVCAVIINGASPIVHTAVVCDGFTRAGFDTFAASVAQRGFFQFGFG